MPMNGRLLRPRQTIHPETADWANRVRTNGGSASGTTLSAVDRFVKAIIAAGIRDRFYRLNLFCGNSDASLNAVRTPLFRGPSLTGTQYGGATDTNINFVQGDYSETVGLSTQNLASKYLDTGLATSSLPAGVISSGHLAAWHGPIIAGYSNLPQLLGAWSSTDRANLAVNIQTSGTAGEQGRFGRTDAVSSTDAPLGLNRASAFVLTQRTSATNLEIWRDGNIVATNSNSTTGIQGVSFSVFVFRFNNQGTQFGSDGMGGALRGYSVGDDMTSAQVLAFRSAWSAFNNAMGRTA